MTCDAIRPCCERLEKKRKEKKERKERKKKDRTAEMAPEKVVPTKASDIHRFLGLGAITRH